MTLSFVTPVLISIILIFSGCRRCDIDVDAHSCIKEKIRQIKSEKVTNPPTEIWKWEVAGKTYYYITSGCCDQYSYLYDENCKMICAPDGGITGNGDGNCPEFNGEIEKTLVWKDDRN